MNSKSSKTHYQICKNRTLATLHKLSHQFSRNIYKTNIKYRICFRLALPMRRNNITKHCKTSQPRQFDIRQQRSNAFPQNIYKTNIKSMNCDLHRNHQKHFIKYTKCEHLQPSTNSHISFRETFIKPIWNTEYASVWPFQDPDIIKKKIKTN